MKISTKYIADVEDLEAFEKIKPTRTFDDGTTKSGRRVKKQKTHRKEKIEWNPEL